jgi:type IV pilus assembly protein PilA
MGPVDQSGQGGQGKSSSSCFVIAAVVACVGVVGIVVIGIVAAIAIPSLLRARVSANEAAAIGDIRTVISAQVAYQSANGGLYAPNLNCLAKPAECIPGYSGPEFLDTALASGVNKSGYAHTFRAGPLSRTRGRSGSGTSSWTFVAHPVEFGKTGVRSFCGDATGTIKFTFNGVEPTPVNGECSGQELR